MVVGRRDEEQVNRLRDIEPVTTHLHGPECRDATIIGCAPQVVERALAHVKRINDAGLLPYQQKLAAIVEFFEQN